jgi:hypothetical protein
LTPDQLLTRLLALQPRFLQVLAHVAFEDGDVSSLAAKYAIGRPQAERLLSRALQSLEGSPVVNDDNDSQVTVFIQQNKTLLELRTHSAALKAGLSAAELREAQSPRRRYEPMLRWVAIVLIVGLSAYFWWKEREQARVPQRRSAPPTPHE